MVREYRVTTPNQTIYFATLREAQEAVFSLIEVVADVSVEFRTVTEWQPLPDPTETKPWPLCEDTQTVSGSPTLENPEPDDVPCPICQPQPPPHMGVPV